jgi:hypothetical protein
MKPPRYYECEDCGFRTFNWIDAGVHTIKRANREHNHHCHETEITASKEAGESPAWLTPKIYKGNKNTGK